MTAAPATPRETFYAARRTFRKPGVYVFLFLSILISVVFGFEFFSVTKPHSGKDQILLFIAIFFGWCAIMGLKKIISGKVETMELSSEGLAFDNTHWAWIEIAAIGKNSESFSKRVFLRVETLAINGRPATIKLLQGDEPLDAARYAQIASRLSQFLTARYPHVKLQT